MNEKEKTLIEFKLSSFFDLKDTLRKDLERLKKLSGEGDKEAEELAKQLIQALEPPKK